MLINQKYLQCGQSHITAANSPHVVLHFPSRGGNQSYSGKCWQLRAESEIKGEKSSQ